MDKGYEVGDILEGSWGYDQTNVDFYRVVRRTPSTVWMQPLATVHSAEVGFMTTRATPGESTGEPVIRRKLHRRDGEAIGCSFQPSYGWISTWDGKPAFASHYA
jgi:hypothetical protein